MPIPVASDPPGTDSGPQKVLALTLYDEKEMTQTEIAAELGIAQSTVSRWIKDARHARDIHYRDIARDGFLILMAVCAVIITAAVATIAWG
jgi:predicted transcriptional regulator